MCEFSAQLVHMGGYPENCSEQNCEHDFCRVKCLLVPDSQHLKLNEVQLPLPSTQGNELPNSVSHSWGSRAEALTQFSFLDVISQGNAGALSHQLTCQSRKGKIPKLECWPVWPLLPHQPGELIIKKASRKASYCWELQQLCSVNGIKTNLYLLTPTAWASWGTDGFHVFASMGDKEMELQCWFETWATTKVY